MYQVGEYIVYGLEGVCRVTEIGHPRLSGIPKDRLYYTLEPYSRAGAVYIPVDTDQYMRYPLSREEIEAYLFDLPSLPLCSELPTDARMVTAYYMEILHSHDCRRILQMCKTIYCKQCALSGSRKSLSVTDMRYWKQGEELLASEIGYVLGQEPLQIIKMLRQSMEPR